MNDITETSPLSHIVDVRRIKQSGEITKVQPKKRVLADLAEAQGLLEVTHFDAKLVLRPWRKNGAKLSGTIKAEVVHACSMTLDPVQQSISAEFENNFAPIGDLKRAPKPKMDVEDGALLLDFDDNEPDYFEGATIDIGATLEEYFALELDPYPRADHAALPKAVVLTEDDIQEDKPSPFADLAKWKEKPN